MSVIAATWLVRIIGLYSILGILFALAFAWRGAARIDPVAAQGTRGFRLLILPASAALWPYLLRRWIAGPPPPEQRDAHRDAARAEESAR